MRTSALLLASALTLGLAAPALAEHETRVVEAPASAALTVYDDGFALVREKRAAALEKGETVLELRGLPRQMQPDTVLLRPPPGIGVLEQTHDFGTITRDRLLQEHLGREVTLVRLNPATGAQTTERVRIMGIQGGLVVENGGRIETVDPDRIIFDQLPAGLSARPSLTARLAAPEGGKKDLELSYLTGGLSWKADYVAELQADGKLALTGWITLTNDTGSGFKDARLQVVSAQLNRVSRGGAPEMADMRMKTMALPMSAPAPEPAQESLGGGHLFTVERPVTIGPLQTKQLALLTAPAVTVERTYVLEQQPHIFYAHDRMPHSANAQLQLVLNNSEKAGLGRALPAGVVRVYQRDSKGNAQFGGEDRLDHLAVGETDRLTLGSDVDLPAKRVLTEVRQVAQGVVEQRWEVRLTNGKADPVTVLVKENFPGDWTVIEESRKHRTEDGRAVWAVEVPAGGQATLTYRVRLKG